MGFSSVSLQVLCVGNEQNNLLETERETECETARSQPRSYRRDLILQASYSRSCKGSMLWYLNANRLGNAGVALNSLHEFIKLKVVPLVTTLWEDLPEKITAALRVYMCSQWKNSDESLRVLEFFSLKFKSTELGKKSSEFLERIL